MTGPAERPTTDPSDLRVVGRVVKAHGLRGELVVDPSTDNVAERFAPGTTLHVTGIPGRGLLTVTEARWHSGRLLVVAEEATDAVIADPDEFHDHQLEGLAVQLLDGTAVGTVTAVAHGAGGELLVVDAEHGELLVPFVKAIVPEVDLPGGRVLLDPPEGLLDPA